MTPTTAIIVCLVFLIVYAILIMIANTRLSKLDTRLDFLEEQIVTLHKISRNQAEINQQVHDILFKAKDVD